MSRRLVTYAWPIGIVAAAAGLVFMFKAEAPRGPGSDVGQAPVTICFSWTIGLLPGLARAEGFFLDEGLPVTLKPYPSGRDALAGMLAGACHFATVAETPIVLKSFERQDFRIVAMTRVLTVHNKIIARRDHGIDRPGDLEGKRIGVLRATSAHFFLYRFLLEQGLAMTDVNVVFLDSAPKLRRALMRGDIDAIALWEPHTGRAQAELGGDAVAFAAPGLVINTANLVATESLLAERPDSIPPLLRALLRAQAFADTEPDRAVASVAQLVGEPLEEVAANWTGELGLSLRQAYLLALEEEAHWALRSGLVVGTEIPNYLNLIYLDGLKQVAPQVVTVLH